MTYPVDDPRFMPGASYFVIACRAARAHDRLAAACIASYGGHGPDVSGCVRDHFPDHIKDTLRGLAKLARESSESGYAARPARVRMSTMRKLAGQIAAAHGSGFYGPQPVGPKESM